jgi:hypothetical protein
VHAHSAYLEEDHVPFRFSDNGFKKDVLPKDLFNEILEFHKSIGDGWIKSEAAKQSINFRILGSVSTVAFLCAFWVYLQMDALLCRAILPC